MNPAHLAESDSDHPVDEELVTFEKVGMDGLSLKGIQTKIGISKDKLVCC
jgi:hypothetical protein